MTTTTDAKDRPPVCVICGCPPGEAGWQSTNSGPLAPCTCACHNR